MDDFNTIINGLWILLAITITLIPNIQKRLINSARLAILTKLGRERGTNVITLIHRQETLSFLNIPLSRYIDIDDSEEVLRAIRATPEGTPIDLILHTPGGLALAATQIAFALKAHKGKKTVMVPHYAMSGGTLIALAADEIIMDPHACLGQVDPQLGDQQGSYAAASLLRVVEKKQIDKMDDKTLYLVEESRMALEQIRDIVRQLVGDKYSENDTERIIEELAIGKHTHDYPLMAEDARKLFSQTVNTNLPIEVYRLMHLYKMETSTRRPGVEFIPVASQPRPA